MNCLSVSSDGRFALTGADDKKIILWDVKSGKRIRTLEGHLGGVNSVCFSPDGKYAVSGSDDGTLILWDISRGEKVSIFEGHSLSDVNSVCFSPDGQYVLSGSSDKTMILWNIRKGEIIQTYEGHTSYINSVSISPDGKYALSGSQDWTIILWNLQTGAKLLTLREHSSWVKSVCFSPDGKSALSGSDDGKVILWDLMNGEKIFTMKGQSGAVNSVCFSSDGRYALSGSENGKFAIWNIQTGQMIREIESGSSIISVCFSPDHSIIFCCHIDEISVWSFNTNMRLLTMKGHSGMINTVCFSPDGRYALAGSSFDNDLILWDIQKGEVIRNMAGRNSSIPSVCFSPDGNDALQGAIDGGGLFFLWDVHSGEEIREFYKHSDDVTSVYFSPDGSQALSGSWDNTIKLWDVQKGIEIRTLKGHDAAVFSVCYSPDGLTALSGSFDKTIKLWNLQNGKVIRTFKGHTSTVNSVCYAPDGHLALSGSVDNTLKLWDIDSGQELLTFIGHSRDVTSACFSPNGQLALSGSADSTLRIWDIHTGKELLTLRGHTDIVTSVCFSPDGRCVLSGSRDHTMKLWDANTGEEKVTLIGIELSDWLITTPDRYFSSSIKALKYLSYRIGNQLYGFEQFDLKFNRPDLILEELGYAPDKMIESYRNAYYKRLRKMDISENMLQEDFHVPEISVLNKDSIAFSADSQIIKVKIQSEDSLYLLDRINILINDVPIFGINGIDLRSFSSKSMKKEVEIVLSQGMNKIEVSVLNQVGAESLKETIYTEYQGQGAKPDLYLVTIGVSEFKQQDLNLKYSVKDGRDLVGLFTNDSNLYHQIFVDSLFNQNVTRENVLSLKQKLMNSRVDDLVILFLSGHGLLSDSLDFYYATYDMDFMHPEINGVLYDDIEGLLDGIPARKKLLMIDACHSGEVDKDELVALNAPASLTENNSKKGDIKVYDYKGVGTLQQEDKLGLQNSFELMQELFTNLSRGSGAVVISAAPGKGYALEGPEWNNGVFTYAVLNGLKNNAAERDGSDGISVSELKDYVILEVEKITRGAQKPTCRRENLEVDWRVW